MSEILHDFCIRASAKQVFRVMSNPEVLTRGGTKRCSGQPAVGSQYELWFGPQFDWRALVSRCSPDTEFELQMTTADPDWLGTRVGFAQMEKDSQTQIHFHYTGWRENEHYRVSSYCWAMYFRLLKRYIETGEVVPYEQRLDV